MTDILSEEVSAEDLKTFENTYHKHLYRNEVTPKVQFEYAWCLIRSKYPADIKKGILFLEELYKTHKEGKRDYLYYLAIGNARIKQYSKALEHVRSFLSVEPGNQQALQLEKLIKKRMDKEGLIGIAVAGGICVAMGAIVAVGMKLASGGKV